MSDLRRGRKGIRYKRTCMEASELLPVQELHPCKGSPDRVQRARGEDNCEPAPRMRYKADDSQYSLEHLLRAQEVDG